MFFDKTKLWPWLYSWSRLWSQTFTKITTKLPCNETYVTCLRVSGFWETFKSIKEHKNPSHPHHFLQNVEGGHLWTAGRRRGFLRREEKTVLNYMSPNRLWDLGGHFPAMRVLTATARISGAVKVCSLSQDLPVQGTVSSGIKMYGFPTFVSNIRSQQTSASLAVCKDFLRWAKYIVTGPWHHNHPLICGKRSSYVNYSIVT